MGLRPGVVRHVEPKRHKHRADSPIGFVPADLCVSCDHVAEMHRLSWTRVRSDSPVRRARPPRGWFPLWLAVAARPRRGRRGRRACTSARPGDSALAPHASMALVRIAIVVVVAFLLLRPVWVTEHEGREAAARRRARSTCRRAWTARTRGPNTADQWRVAIAYDLVAAGQGHPDRPRPARSPPTTDARPAEADRGRPRRARPTRSSTSSTGSAAVGPLEVVHVRQPPHRPRPADADWLKDLAADRAADRPRRRRVRTARPRRERPAGRRSSSSPTAARTPARRASTTSPASAPRLQGPAARLRRRQLGVRAAATPRRGRAGRRCSWTTPSPSPSATRSRASPTGTVEIVAEVRRPRGGRRKAIDPGPRRATTCARCSTFTPTKEDAEAKKQELTVTVTVTDRHRRDRRDAHRRGRQAGPGGRPQAQGAGRRLAPAVGLQVPPAGPAPRPPRGGAVLPHRGRPRRR